MTGRARPGPAVTALVILNALIFLWGEFLPGKALVTMQDLLALSREGIRNGSWWQFLTHAFLHAGFWHLFFNLLVLWLAGNPVERFLGTAKFLVVYGLSVLGAGLFQVFCGSPNALLLGASGGVSGVVVAFATLFPDLPLAVLLLVPLRLKAKYLGLGVTGAALIFTVAGWQSGVGHAAHLGGCLTGYLATRAMGYGRKTRGERWFRRPSND